MSSISSRGALPPAPAVQASVLAPAHGPAQGLAALASLGAGGATSAMLRAEVEPLARGLSVAQHAERVLAQLLAEPAR